jgi:hypothetical protein
MHKIGLEFLMKDILKRGRKSGVWYNSTIRSSNNINENVIEEHLDEKIFESHNIFLGTYDCGIECNKASLNVKRHLFNELSSEFSCYTLLFL